MPEAQEILLGGDCQTCTCPKQEPQGRVYPRALDFRSGGLTPLFPAAAPDIL